MNYKLAKELKDAEFPGSEEWQKHPHISGVPYFRVDGRGVPTLSEGSHGFDEGLNPECRNTDCSGKSPHRHAAAKSMTPDYRQRAREVANNIWNAGARLTHNDLDAILERLTDEIVAETKRTERLRCDTHIEVIKDAEAHGRKKERAALIEKVEGMRKVHREFECGGAHGGKGCYETWCEMETCTSKEALTFKSYNQALDDLLTHLRGEEKCICHCHDNPDARMVLAHAINSCSHCQPPPQENLNPVDWNKDGANSSGTQEETECPACTDELKYVLPQPVQHTCQKMEETECCSLCGTVSNGTTANRLEPHEFSCHKTCTEK